MKRHHIRQSAKTSASAVVLALCVALTGCSQPTDVSTPPPGSARPLADKALETLSSSSADKLRELFPGENSQTVQQVYDGCSDVASAGRNVATDDTISPKLFNVKLTGASRSNPGGRAGCDFALIWTAGKRWEISIGHTSTSTAG